MIDKTFKDKALAEAIRIAENMYLNSSKDDNGIFWKTLEYDGKEQDVIFTTSENIYSGISGIAYFYLSLYKITGTEKYLDICKEAMRWVANYCRNNSTYSYAFLTGRMSAVFVLSKLHEVCKGTYLNEALEIAKNCDTFVESKIAACEYINGASGTVISLLHLYDLSGESFILDKINLFVEYIIGKASYNKYGLHWDKSDLTSHSLTGFSHGASGIGFMFLELGKYFNKPEFYFLAEQAFAYESHFFDEKVQNWMDLRKGMYTDKEKKIHREAFLNKNFDFFSEPSFMNAWCHGAAGIGLSRFKAFELLNDKIYKKELEICVTNVIEDFEKDLKKGNSLTFCHGICGNLDLLIDAIPVLKNENFSKAFASIIASLFDNIQPENGYVSGLAAFAKGKEDFSLFNGNSGIGYFCLRLLDPEKIGSILAPALKDTGYLINDTGNDFFKIIRHENLCENIINKVYPRTLRLMNIFCKQDIKLYFRRDPSGPRENIIENFNNFAGNILSLNSDYSKLIMDAYSFETEKLTLENEIKSYSLINARKVFLPDINKDILKDEKYTLTSKAYLNPDVRIFETKFKWETAENINYDNMRAKEEEETYYLLSGSHEGISERIINPFSYLILSQFKNEDIIENALTELIKEIETPDKESGKKLRSALLEQIENLINGNVLLIF